MGNFPLHFLPRLCLLAAIAALAATPCHGAETQEVKTYLVSTLQKIKRASEDFVAQAGAYSALLEAEGGPEKAWAQKKCDWPM